MMSVIELYLVLLRILRKLHYRAVFIQVKEAMNDLDTSQSGIDNVGLASVVIVPQLSAGVKLDFPNDMLPLEETEIIQN